MASESNVPVVHFYPASPYAFKLLLALGLKGIAFDSHLVAPIPPRKATQTLANGHRRIPVLQLGNELFCDTASALAALEARFKESPSLTPSLAGTLTATAYAAWADKIVFPATAALLPWEHLPAAFRADRAIMSARDPSTFGCRSHGDVLVRELQSQSQSGDGVERIRMGDFVAVSPDDYGKVQITGRLLYLSETQVVIQHQVHEGDEFWTALYFPRSGYVVSKRDSASKL
ncbi:hypothetical protein BC830DRAFT_953914 [Chytriomyces sp. MP71]|nr:hypothetical protein BC830DRAFT_953914 [Chytriomyces sp. MP71]